MKKTGILILQTILISFVFLLLCGRQTAYANSTDLNAFPASYRSYISNLINSHPDWVFVPYNTGIDWNELVRFQAEKDRSLIEKSSNPEKYFSKAAGNYNPATGTYIGKSGSNWVVPNDETIMHYLDPRNFLNTTDVFMFLKLDYEPSVHTEGRVNELLKGSWMYSRALEDDASMTYAQAFVRSGAENNVSPFLLAARVRQEQGSGTSPLISGTYGGYEGYYNYFNINASGSTTAAIIQNGLSTAKANGWDTRYKSIYGGAKTLATRYIARKQYTIYFQKFDVVNGISYHQYMQNIQAPYTEGRSIYKSYLNSGILEAAHVFSIPVYNNMPTYVCALPGETPQQPLRGNLSAGRVDRMFGTMTVKVSNITGGSGVSAVTVKAYSSVNGADDAHTYAGVLQNDGSYIATVDISNHNGYRGEYTMEAIVTDTSGQQVSLGSVRMVITEMLEAKMDVQQIGDRLYVTILDAEGYNGVLEVRVPTWSDANGQDDLVWYKADYNASAGYWQLNIDLKDHSMAEPVYNLHLYIVDGNGNLTFWGGQTLGLGDTDFSYGDVTFDHVVNAEDALKLLRLAADLDRKTYALRTIGDAHMDEIINAQDALAVLKKAAGLIDQLPEGQ